MIPTPTLVEQRAIRAGYEALRNSSSPTSYIVEQVVAALGAKGLLCVEARRPVALRGREYDVLLAAARGLSEGQTARELGLSPNTVKTHRRRLFARLEVHDIAHAVGRAVELGLLTPRAISGGGRP